MQRHARRPQKECSAAAPQIFKSPNNILAIEYIKALRRLGSGITPITLQRVGAGHDSAELFQTASASKLREMLKNGDDIRNYMPEEAFGVFADEMRAGRAPIFTDSFETAILSKLRQMPREEFSLFDCGDEGLGDRLYKK